MKKLLSICLLFFVLVAASSLKEGLSEDKDSFLNALGYVSVNDYSSKEVYVREWWGILGKYNNVLKIKLLNNTQICLTNCEAILELMPYKNITSHDALSQLKFYTLGNKDVTDKIDFVVTYETTEKYSVKENDYCNCTFSKSSNLPLCNCTTKFVEKERIVEKLFSDLKILEKEKIYKVHIRGKKPVNSVIDWVGTFAKTNVKDWAWWNSTWTKCRNINITTTNEWINGIFVANITGLSGNIKGLEIVNAPCNENGVSIPRTIISNTSNSALVTFLVNGTNPAYSVYYDPLGNYTSSQNITLFYDEFNALSPIWTDIDGGEATRSIDNGWLKIEWISGWGSAWANTTSFFGNANDVHSLIWFKGRINSLSNEGQIRWGINSCGTGGGDCDFVEYHIYKPWGYAKFRIGQTAYQEAIAISNIIYDPADYVIKFNSTGAYSYPYYTALTSGATSSSHLGITFGSYQPSTHSIDFVRIYPDYANFYTSDFNYTIGEEEEAISLTVTLNQPIDNAITPLNSVIFNCSAKTSNILTLQNITVYVWRADNTLFTETETYGDRNNATKITTTTISEGINKWNCYVCDNAECKWALLNRSIRLDTTPPIINIISPQNNTEFISFSPLKNLTLEFDSEDVMGLDSCWFNNGTTNISYSCNTQFQYNFTQGSNILKVWANDTAGNIGENQTVFFVNYVIFSANYTSPILEDYLVNPIQLQIYATSIRSLNGTLHYNGNIYSTVSKNNGTYGTLTTSTVSNTDNLPKSFYWNLTLNDQSLLSSNYTQQFIEINPLIITSGNCPNGLNDSQHFTFKLENNMSSFENVDVNLNFVYGILNSSFKTSNASLTNISSFRICINGTQGNYTLSYGEIQYSAQNYVTRRHYSFNGIKLTQSTINYILYLLQNNLATSFLFTFQDTQFNNYIGKYVALLRWYPQSNKYEIVEMGKTDDKGQTIMHVVTEDVDYRVALYEVDGTLIKLANPARFACLTNPCTYTMQISPTLSTTYLEQYRMQANLDWDAANKKWTLTWNDPAQTTSGIFFRVTKLGGQTDTTVCNVNSTSYTGVLTCDISAYNSGTFLAEAFRAASPENPFASDIKTLITDNIALRNSTGLFFTGIIAIFVAFLGIYNPAAAIILSIVGLIPAVIFHSIPIVIIIGFALLAMFVMSMFKKVS